jgi:hypothetical protein
MSSRLARQSLDFLTKSTPKNKDSGSNKKDKKLILPKTNRGIKKVKHEIRYGQHQKTRKMQEERRKRENPIGNYFAFVAHFLVFTQCV